MQEKKRELWVDNVKVLACFLVVTGHFFSSMTPENFLPKNDLYQWFIQTIYYFHVQLFFICSGYLFQKLSKVEGIRSWGNNVWKKALNLGVPYFTFSFATWILKTVFSSSTHNQIGGLSDTLFLHPTAPYWYLYALFFIFLVTWTFRNKTMASMGLTIAVGLKLLGIMGMAQGVSAISYILSNEIWFVIGMCLSVWDVKGYIEKRKIITPVILGVLFLVLSVLIYRMDVKNGMVGFLMGLIACCSILMLLMIIFKDGKQPKAFGYMAKYTMPIFLMHTLFAASLRAILLRLGVQNAAVHVVMGFAISFVGPIVAAVVMKKSKWLEFFLYPGKFIMIR